MKVVLLKETLKMQGEILLIEINKQLCEYEIQSCF